jgi:hypothetical protein
MFAVIRHYHFNPKDAAEIDRRIREEFVPIVKHFSSHFRPERNQPNSYAYSSYGTRERE